MEDLTSYAASSILVEPTFLVFPPPHCDRAVENLVSLYNMSNLKCLFKIKALTPARYYITPNIGILDARSGSHLRFILRQQKENLPHTTQDFFRICAKLLPAEVLGKKQGVLSRKQLKELWTNLGDHKNTVIKDLSCSFSGEIKPSQNGIIRVLDTSKNFLPSGLKCVSKNLSLQSRKILKFGAALQVKDALRVGGDLSGRSQTNILGSVKTTQRAFERTENKPTDCLGDGAVASDTKNLATWGGKAWALWRKMGEKYYYVPLPIVILLMVLTFFFSFWITFGFNCGKLPDFFYFIVKIFGYR